MVRIAYILSLVTLLALPEVASARVLGPAGSGYQPERSVSAASHPAAGIYRSAGVPDLQVIQAAHGGFVAYGGGMRAAPRFGSGRFVGPGFHRFPSRVYPFRSFRFRPFVSFGFAFPLYAPYYPYYTYYPYNPYCDPASAYYYPPWCPY